MSLTLRTDDELDAALAALAELEGISRQEVIRKAVLDRLAHSAHSSAVEESTSRMLLEWADVLDRLGNV
ncbi:MAG: ribbon-helix-helix protein, CopG family [Actinomycetota bacterium]|nr:ribbon-helix-helix protein, CopG family [Actinomycetota bacterium]